jgi:hypothetical protein
MIGSRTDTRDHVAQSGNTYVDIDTGNLVVICSTTIVSYSPLMQREGTDTNVTEDM